MKKLCWATLVNDVDSIFLFLNVPKMLSSFGRMFQHPTTKKLSTMLKDVKPVRPRPNKNIQYILEQAMSEVRKIMINY